MGESFLGWTTKIDDLDVRLVTFLLPEWYGFSFFAVLEVSVPGNKVLVRHSLISIFMELGGYGKNNKEGERGEITIGRTIVTLIQTERGLITKTTNRPMWNTPRFFGFC